MENEARGSNIGVNASKFLINPLLRKEVTSIDYKYRVRPIEEDAGKIPALMQP